MKHMNNIFFLHERRPYGNDDPKGMASYCSEMTMFRRSRRMVYVYGKNEPSTIIGGRNNTANSVMYRRKNSVVMIYD